MHAPGADSPMGWVGSCSEDHYCKPRFPFEYPAAGSQILYMCIIAKALVDSGEEPHFGEFRRLGRMTFF
jgi:hypothetical protein